MEISAHRLPVPSCAKIKDFFPSSRFRMPALNRPISAWRRKCQAFNVFVGVECSAVHKVKVTSDKPTDALRSIREYVERAKVCQSGFNWFNVMFMCLL